MSCLSGTIELHELQLVMRKLGQNPSEHELIEMINSVDENGDNEIDFNEFLVLMKSRIGERDPEKELRDAFAVFESDGSGSIDRKELKRLMKKLGQALTDGELDAMMDEVDTNGDGEISFEEFKAMMVRDSFEDFIMCVRLWCIRSCSASNSVNLAVPFYIHSIYNSRKDNSLLIMTPIHLSEICRMLFLPCYYSF